MLNVLLYQNFNFLEKNSIILISSEFLILFKDRDSFKSNLMHKSVNVVKLFSSLLKNGSNKLECSQVRPRANTTTWFHSQTLNQAVKTRQVQTLQLIWPIRKLRREKFLTVAQSD